MTNLTPPSPVDRARLLIHCLTHHCDATRGYLPYFYAYFSDRPPVARFAQWSYGDGLGRTVAAMLLLRCMTGENFDQLPDTHQRAMLMGMTGPDGLSWIPAEPWTLPLPHMDPKWQQRGFLMALATLWEVTRRDPYRVAGERLVDAMLDLYVNQRETYLVKSNIRTSLDVGSIHEGVNSNPSWNAVLHTAALLFYRRTGYSKALDLASLLIEYALKESEGGARLFEKGHFHSDSQLVLALLLRGATLNSEADILLGEELYVKAKGLGTQSGWFPERAESEVSETCCLVDMIECGILLAWHRNPKYWEDVERFTRNHLATHQITETEWMRHLDPKTTCVPEEMKDGFVTGEQVREQLRGGFAGYGAVSSFSYHQTVEPYHASLSNSNQHCCNAAGGRALYSVWRYGVEDDGKSIGVHLHLHRNHPAFRLQIKEDENFLELHLSLKQPRKLNFRLPEGVSFAEASVFQEDEAVAGLETRRGDAVYLSLGPFPAGSRLKIRFPQKWRTTEEHAARQNYTFQWMGANVVKVSPVLGTPELFTADRFSASLPGIRLRAGP